MSMNQNNILDDMKEVEKVEIKMEMNEKYQWGVLNDGFRFYQPIRFFPSSNWLVEFLVSVHIYILAACLVIREALFASRPKLKQIKSELYSSRLWSLKSKNRRKVLVIGGDGTIGSHIVNVLQSEFECHVTVHHKTMRSLIPDANIEIYELDLTDRDQIIILANQLKSHHFEVIVFAAGVMLSPELRTSDGVELHNAVNVIGQTMLYELLQNECKRAIFLSSATARMACFSKDPNFLSVYAGPYQAYASSKMNLAIYVSEVAKRRHVTAVSLHPGTVPGNLYQNANPIVRYLNSALLPKILRSPEISATIVLHTIFQDNVQPGAYYEDSDTIDLVKWVPEEERHRIYETIRRRIELWMEQ